MEICKKVPKIVKLYTGCPTAAAVDFIINRLKPKHEKSSILNRMKWKQQKDTSLALQSHFARRNLDRSDNQD